VLARCANARNHGIIKRFLTLLRHTGVPTYLLLSYEVIKDPSSAVLIRYEWRFSVFYLVKTRVLVRVSLRVTMIVLTIH